MFSRQPVARLSMMTMSWCCARVSIWFEPAPPVTNQSDPHRSRKSIICLENSHLHILESVAWECTTSMIQKEERLALLCPSTSGRAWTPKNLLVNYPALADGDFPLRPLHPRKIKSQRQV